MIDVTTCPHCGAVTVFGECSECFWAEEPIDVVDVRLDERDFNFPFVME